MKSKIFIIVLLSVIIVSCTKDKTVNNKSYIDVPTTLIGSWNWLYSSGGFAGVTYTPETTGEVRKIEFDADNNFKYYVNDILKSEHTFHIEKSKSITGQDSALIITNLLWSRQSITFRTSDTLILLDECYDCFGHCYIRIK